jgi:Cellulase (glycosyl hydrolase family 5)
MLGSVLPAHATVRKDDPASIRGAIYVPAGAYNAPQLWKNFSLEETKRDFGYAKEVHLNALRMWASYEYWRMEPATFQSEFDQMLGAAHDSGIRILISLFENDGVAPTPENMWTTDPKKAFDIQSPGREIATGDKSQWGEPRRFVEWFMKRYGNDDRILAIEVMNEPNDGGNGRPGTVPFAQSMFQTAKSLQGTVPLTLGSARVKVAKEFIPLGLDIINFHDNFPESTQALANSIKEAMAVGKRAGLPVWLTEWQRVRTGGSGWGPQGVTAEERVTDYASLAPTVYSYPIGSFFWSLMVKPAYLRAQRLKGTVNGLFWPDGAVTSVKDARAIADDPKLQFRERPIPANFSGVAM